MNDNLSTRREPSKSVPELLVKGANGSGGLEWRRRFIGILLLLIAGDLLFIALHMAFKLDLVNSELCNLSRDGGFSEFFQYAKFSLIIIALLLQSKKGAHPTHFAWCFGFGYLLVDDAFRVHENTGPFLARHLSLPLLPGQLESVGELLATGFFGSLILLFVMLAYRRAHESERLMSQRLMFLLVLLFLCGVVIDAAHTWVDKNYHVKVLSGLLGVMEDGGEMVVVSLMCAYVLVHRSWSRWHFAATKRSALYG